MENTNKLIVPMHKENVKQLISFMPIIIGGIIIWISLLNIISYYILNFISDGILSTILLNLIFYIQIAIYSFVGLMVFLTTHNYFFVDYNIPAAILDENGIWTKRHSLIPWENIDQVKACQLPTVKHIEFVGIYFKDTRLRSKQFNWRQKAGILWANFFKFPHITLANIALSNDEVINFAKKFVPDK